MESQVKSFLTQKTYTSQLEKLEEEDRDAMSELYKISISGTDILVAPGKTIMTESGVAYCYVYVIQQDKVICKLGVYEKKTDTMPMFFDLSSFPEDSLRLFEEYEIVPTRLLDFKMKEELASSNNVFDYLIRELFPKIQDKKKRLNETYSLLHKIYTKDDQDKEMRPILKLISATRKTDPTESFLETLKQQATDKNKFALTLLALQPFFNVKFQFKNDTEHFENVQKYEELARRWAFDAPTTLNVNIDTYEWIQDNGLSVIPEETSKMNSVNKREPEEFKSEPETEPESEPYEPVAETEPDLPLEPIGELEEYNPEPEPASVPLPRPPPVRKGQTMKTKAPKESKASKVPKESKVPKAPTVRGTSMNEVIEPTPSVPLNSPSMNDIERPLPDLPLNDGPRGTSLNSVAITKPVKRTKAKSSESMEEPEPSAKIKIKRISKPKTKPKSESTKE
jgi:hypothetical protein